MSGDIVPCHDWGRDANSLWCVQDNKNAAKHPVTHRNTHDSEELFVPKGPGLRNLLYK